MAAVFLWGAGTVGCAEAVGYVEVGRVGCCQVVLQTFLVEGLGAGVG